MRACAHFPTRYLDRAGPGGDRGARAGGDDPAVRLRIEGLGQVIFPADQQNPAGLAAYQTAEIKKWWPVMKAAGLKAIAQGFALVHQDRDHEKIRLETPLYDALYVWCQQQAEQGR